MLVAAIVLSLAAFRIAFVLGAYHTVFQQDIFTVLVASSVTLVGTAAAPAGSHSCAGGGAGFCWQPPPHGS